MKKRHAANFETLVHTVSSDTLNEEREHFHEFLLAYFGIFTKNAYSANLQRLIEYDT